MRRCSYVISTCASDWADSEVEATCFAYTDYYCNGTDYLRNPHCALCNHVDLFETYNCTGLRAISGLSEILNSSHEDSNFLELLNFNHEDSGLYKLLNSSHEVRRFSELLNSSHGDSGL